MRRSRKYLLNIAAPAAQHDTHNVTISPSITARANRIERYLQSSKSIGKMITIL